MTTMFNSLSVREKRAMFFAALVNETQGKVDNEILFNIANSLSTSRDREIVVTSDAREFALHATGGEVGFYHDWAGEYYTKRTVVWLYGGGTPGEHTSKMYSKNGKDAGEEVVDTLPEFDVTKLQVIHVEIVNYSNYNGGNLEDRLDLQVVFYIPAEHSYIVSPAIQYILDNFPFQG